MIGEIGRLQTEKNLPQVRPLDELTAPELDAEIHRLATLANGSKSRRKASYRLL